MQNRLMVSLIVASCLLRVPLARAERVLSNYDLMSLCAMAHLIVKAEVGEAMSRGTGDDHCTVYDVRVLTVFKGDIKPETVLRVAGLDEYHLTVPWVAGQDAVKPFERGATVYLFMQPTSIVRSYLKYRRSDAQWTILESGVRYLYDNQIYSFEQFFGDIPMPKQTKPRIQHWWGGGYLTRTPPEFDGAVPERADRFEPLLHQCLDASARLIAHIRREDLSPDDRRRARDERNSTLSREFKKDDYFAPYLSESLWGKIKPGDADDLAANPHG